MRANFPFAALVGQADLQAALLRVAVDPGIGGVLVTGTRGTAKSTAVRALADLLPPLESVSGDAAGAHVATPFVELPLGATEDRVIGTLDVRALLAGERRFEPGLLAKAHRGILYVDEVNLLPDHLVDVVLDVAASGTNVVERDGASFAHDARIVLVGTMNPEEGELRPQLLDRFGLCVAIENDDDIERRIEIVERRIAFDLDPAGFSAAYDEVTRALRERIARARTLLPSTVVERACLRRAAEHALAANVEGMRADLTIVRTARAIAALDGRTHVSADDIDRAAPAALAHRRRDGAPLPPTPPSAPPPKAPQRSTNGTAPNDSTRTDTPHDNGHVDAPAPGGAGARGEGDVDADARDDAHTDANANATERPTTEARGEQVFEIGSGSDLGRHLEGRRGVAIAKRSAQPNARLIAALGRGTAATSGGVARMTLATTTRISALGTIRAAATARNVACESHANLVVESEHLRFITRRGRARQLVVFLVDASGSMAAAARMRAAKGVVCSLLATAYRQRDVVALVAFRGAEATTLVPPTRSAVLAYRRLRSLATGGRTPLARGLAHAHELIAAYARREPATEAHLVIVSDARANAPANSALERAWFEAARLRARGIRALCVDTEAGRIRFGFAAQLATALDATYRHLDDCSERALGATVREWMATA